MQGKGNDISAKPKGVSFPLLSGFYVIDIHTILLLFTLLVFDQPLFQGIYVSFGFISDFNYLKKKIRERIMFKMPILNFKRL